MICQQVTVASVFVPSPVSCVRPLCRCQLTARGVCAASRSTLISPLAKRRILPRKRWLCNCQKHGGRAQLSAAMCVKVTGHTVESIKFYSEQERGKKNGNNTQAYTRDASSAEDAASTLRYSPVFLSVVTADHVAFVFHVSMFSPVCFSQLRAQNQVLKKAVVDEQASTVSLKVNWHIEQDQWLNPDYIISCL